MSALKRMTLIKSKKLYINCLGSGYYALNCKSLTCKKCSSKHNTILHRDEENSKRNSDKSDTSSATRGLEKALTKDMRNSTSKDCEDTLVNICHVQKKTSRVILSTARVYVLDKDSNQHLCHALLDSGSQLNIITEDFL